MVTVFCAAYFVGPVAAVLVSTFWTGLACWDFEWRIARLERELQLQTRLARVDDLTGLGNDRGFRECLRDLDPSPIGQVLALFDVDRFKEYNDAFGHQAGDEVLRELGRILTERLDEASPFYRVGGDEFAVIISSILMTAEGHDALHGAEMIRQAITDHTWPLRPITVSIGLAWVSKETSTLFEEADQALYRAKREGGNRVVLHGVDGPLFS
jgi:diguanylate cyclase